MVIFFVNSSKQSVSCLSATWFWHEYNSTLRTHQVPSYAPSSLTFRFIPYNADGTPARRVVSSLSFSQPSNTDVALLSETNSSYQLEATQWRNHDFYMEVIDYDFFLRWQILTISRMESLLVLPGQLVAAYLCYVTAASDLCLLYTSRCV